MRRLLDALLTTDNALRPRLTQAALAMLVLAAGMLALLLFAATGVAAAPALLAWAAGTGAGLLVFFGLMRSGWSRRLRDPSMTVTQMLFALASAALAYALLGAGRAAVFPVVMVILVLGMFVASPRQMRAVAAYAVLLLGGTMAAMAFGDPRHYPWTVELGHFLQVAIMVPAVALLAGRLSQMRHRARLQRAELAQALSRVRETNTRDELTGLVHRRHMEVLLDREHQRCVRSGQPFCLAMLDIDNFKPVNSQHGYAVGDAVLRAVAQEARQQVRVSDRLARWAGEEFLLMLVDTRAVLARGGIERLQRNVAALRILTGAAAVGVSLSAGLAEHRPGETLEQTLERCLHALAEAKALGRGRVVVAP